MRSPRTSHSTLVLNSWALASTAIATFVAVPLCTHAADALEEIVVTAQRREESLQRVPIAVTAMNPDELETRGVPDITALGQAVPGLVIIPQLNSFSPIIRGVGQTSAAPGSDPGVATYIDGVYMPSPTGTNLGLGAIERIEVLRGPQGTLFGRNATGGVVNIVTAEPKHDFSGIASAAVSDPLTYEGTFYVTGGLSEKIAAAVSGSVFDQEDGFGRNLTTGSDAYYREESLVRAKFKFDISDDTVLHVSGDYNRLETDSGTNRAVVPGTTRLDQATNPSGFWDMKSYLDGFSETKQWGASAQLDHSFGFMSSKTIVAYRDVETQIILDQGYGNLPMIFFDAPFFDRTFTAEMQLISGPDSSFEWIAGAFYLDQNAGTDVSVTVPTTAPLPFFVTHNELGTKSYALFGQTTFHFGDATRFTLGGRWTQDDKTQYAVTNVLPGAVNNEKESWSDPTWRIALDHQFTVDTLGYISYNRGFKSGIYNAFDLPFPTFPPANPEYVDAYETGVKSDLLDGTMRLNIALYYNKYEDIQIQTPRNGQAFLTNAAKAKIYGAELELTYLPIDGLTLSANAAYTRATYSDFRNAPLFTDNVGFALCNPQTNPVNCLESFDATDNKFIGIPELTFTVGATYERNISAGLVGTGFNYFRASERTWGFDERFKTSAYGLLSGNVYYRFGAAEENEVGLFGRNLTNEEYVVYRVSYPLNNIDDPAPGRVIGLQYKRKF